MKIARIDLGDFLDAQGTSWRLPADPQKPPGTPRRPPENEHYMQTSIESETPDSSPLATRMLLYIYKVSY